MGLTFIERHARGAGGEEEVVNLLVDCGVGYPLLPRHVCQSLGLQPTRDEKFKLCDSTVVTRQMSRRYTFLPQGEEHSPVVLGEEGDDQALLGAVALENLGLVLNPLSRTLHPMRLLWRG